MNNKKNVRPLLFFFKDVPLEGSKFNFRNNKKKKF